MKIFFNTDPTEDVIAILAFIDGFAAEYGVEDISIDTQKIEGIIRGMRRDFPHIDGLDEASVFKKVANFISFFVAERPILEPFSSENFPPDILKINNYENAMIALLIGLAALHGAVIHQDGNDVTLINPVELSTHSFIDLVDALSSITPSNHFKLLTVLLEQLAYKTNQDCQYKVKQFSYNE